MIPGNWNQVIRRPSIEGLPPLGLSARVVLSEVAQRCRRAEREGDPPEWRVTLRELARDLEEPSHTTVSRAVKALVASDVLTYRSGVFRLARGLSRALRPQPRRRRQEKPERAPEEIGDRGGTAPEYCTTTPYSSSDDVLQML